LDSNKGSSVSRIDPVKTGQVDDALAEGIESLGRYQIEKEIGRGGMGIVYQARDLELNRSIAVKVLRKEYKGLEEAIQQFSNEAAIMGSLQHPGVIQIYQCGKTPDDRPFHAMKLIRGETMSKHIAERDQTKKPDGALLAIFAAVAQAMAYTHSQEIVHLDLKPANIMVGRFGEVHVMDWGLARSLKLKAQQKRLNHYSLENTTVFEDESNHVHGTLRYMAPEQARAETVDKRTDVFCLGSILCEILTGQPPYTGKDRFKVLVQAQCGILAPALERLDACGAAPSLIRLAKNCMKPVPEDRPQDASFIAKEMAGYQDSELHRLQKDMTRFFELSLDLFCISGFDGFLRRVNESFTHVLGYAQGELLERPFVDIIYEKDRPRTVEAMKRLFEGDPVVHFRNRCIDADGNLVELEWSARSVVSEGLIFAVARKIR